MSLVSFNDLTGPIDNGELAVASKVVMQDMNVATSLIGNRLAPFTSLDLDLYTMALNQLNFHKLDEDPSNT